MLLRRKACLSTIWTSDNLHDQKHNSYSKVKTVTVSWWIVNWNVLWRAMWSVYCDAFTWIFTRAWAKLQTPAWCSSARHGLVKYVCLNQKLPTVKPLEINWEPEGWFLRLLWDLFNSKAFKKGGENLNGDKAEIAFPNRPSCTSYTESPPRSVRNQSLLCLRRHRIKSRL